jgi:hypothetical protein
LRKIRRRGIWNKKCIKENDGKWMIL